MSVEFDTAHAAESEGYLQYRALSSAAVAGLILGMLSPLAMLDWIWVVLPIAGLVVSAVAWRRVSRHRDDLTGMGLAKAGFALSLVFALAGPSRLGYVLATECPEGYAPISYEDLQPNLDKPGEVIPPSAHALDGKRVFIKGYIYPTIETKEFLLVRDQGACCFGGNPKLSDRIHVKLTDPLRLSFGTRMFKVAGTFRVEPMASAGPDVQGGVFYHLEADHLQ
jgi:hypothetical protein